MFPGINKGVELKRVGVGPEAFRGVSSQGAGLWAGWAVPGGAASSPGAGGGCGESEGGVEPRGGGGATGRRGRSLGEGVRAYLMVIWGRSPPSAFSPIRISRMVWDQ